MKIVLRVGGIVFVLFGLIGITSVMGGVISRAPGSADPSGLAFALAFHAVCMALGAFLIVQGKTVKQTA